MAKTLPTSRITQLVEAWSPVIPAVGADPPAQAIVRKIERAGIQATTDDEPARILRDTIGEFRELVRPEVWQRITDTDIYVVPEPLCNAGAELSPRHIVLFDGLFQVLGYRIQLSLLLAEIRKHFDASAHKSGFTQEQFTSAAWHAQLLSLHFLEHPEPLPNFSDLFDERLHSLSSIAFGGSLLFIVLHELGHLELQHRVTAHGPMNGPPPVMACLEDFNFLKKQEYEADAFAFAALVPEARTALIVNVWYLMSLILDFESLAGRYNKSHPLAINRVARLNELSGALRDPALRASARTIFNARLDLMQSRLEPVHLEETRLSEPLRLALDRTFYIRAIGNRDDCRGAVDELLRAYRLIPPTG
jgi:hypothetical protein